MKKILSVIMAMCCMLCVIGCSEETKNTQPEKVEEKKADATSQTVDSEGENEVEEEIKLVDIALGGKHTVGLTNKGTVVAYGEDEGGNLDVADWKDICAIGAGSFYTAGLKNDGTVVVTGKAEDMTEVSEWKDIVAISCASAHMAGLKKDGTVVACGENKKEQCDVSAWTDIVAVECGAANTWGLKKDGTVVAVGDSSREQCDVEKLGNGIIEISGKGEHVVALKADGTVSAVGANRHGQCDVESWQDIKSVSAGGMVTIGMKKDGSAVQVGDIEFSVPDRSDIVFAKTVGRKMVLAYNDGTIFYMGIVGRGDEIRQHKFHVK